MKFSVVIALVLLASPTVVALQGYMSNLSSSGAGGAMKPSSYGPSNGKPQSSSGNSGITGSYLEGMGGGGGGGATAAVPAAQAAPPVAVSHQSAPPPSGPAFSLSEFVDDSTTAAAATTYLSSLKVSSAGAGGSGPQGYLDTLRVQAAEAAANSPAGYLDTLRVSASPGGSGLSTYKDSLSPSSFSSVRAFKGAAQVTVQVEVASETAMMASAEPILAAINKMNENMNNHHETTITVLQDISTSIKKIAIRNGNVAPHQEAGTTTELTSALESSAGAAPAWSGNNWSPQ